MEITETLSLWERLKNMKKPIVLYGMGNGADKILDELARREIAAAGVFASDEFCRGQVFRGFPVLSYAQAKERFGDMAVLVAFGTQRPEVLERIRTIGREQELYVPDVPVYGGTVFDAEYFDAHKTEFAQVYEMLADEKSRQTYCAVLSYKISGKPEYLYACESSVREAYEAVLCIGPYECYADAGAYTGDTVRELVRCAGGYKKIFAIEPDEKNYRKLESYAQTIPNMQCFQAAAYSKESEICFSQRGGRNSAAGAGGKTVRADTLDRMLEGERITYIKYDVEGLEKEALLGTKHIIQTQKPKMLVSAYHRNEDLYELPLLVRQMMPDYQVYMRHYPYIPAWDTNFYFV